MTDAVRLYMSNTHAIDSAWEVLQSGDKVEKFAFLIPAAFGAAGAFTGAGGRLVNPKTGKIDPGFYADPVYQDPLTAGLIAEKEADNRLLGAGVGALQAFNPIGRAVGYATKPLSRGAKALRGGRLHLPLLKSHPESLIRQ